MVGGGRNVWVWMAALIDEGSEPMQCMADGVIVSTTVDACAVRLPNY